MSIRAYVPNGSRGCSFNEWRESVATNRNSVDHEAERETLPFLLPTCSTEKIYRTLNLLELEFLINQTLSEKRMINNSSSVTLPFSSSNSG